MHPSMNYIETTVPPGLTLTDWRRSGRRHSHRRDAVRPRTRRVLPLLRRAA